MPEIDEPTPGNDSVNEFYVQVIQNAYYIQITPGGSVLGIEMTTNMSWLHVTPQMLF